MKIIVGGREIGIDKLKVRLTDWRELSALIREVEGGELSDDEAVDKTLDFYERLLKIFDPNVTREELEQMPVYQLGVEFMSELFTYLFTVPLNSKVEGK